MASADSDHDFARYRHDVYSWAYRLLGRHHDALDVAQDVFLRWTKQIEGSVPDHPRSWLRRVTTNRAIDMVRARATSVPPAPRAPVTGTGSELELQELRCAVAAAMAGLTDMQRSVLTAKVYESLTFRAIAGELGVSVPTVKTHYLRAVRAMRERLDPQWSSPEQRDD